MHPLPRLITGFALLAATIVLADQLSKALIVREIGRDSDRHARWLVGDWLGLSYAENSGVAFGLFRGTSTAMLVLGSVAVLFALGLFLNANRDSTRIWLTGAVIAGGAIGNAIDRLRFGYVRDFFAVGPWPQFNIADAAITIGVIGAALAAVGDVNRSGEPAASGRDTGRRPMLRDVNE